MSVDATWRVTVIEALRRLDPTRPADATTYVERGEGWSALERLELLLLAGVKVRALMVGSIGVGKTSELHRWARSLGGPLTPVLLRLDDPRRWSDGAVWQAVGAAPELRGLDQSLTVRSLASGGVSERVRRLESRDKTRVVLLIDGLDLLPLAEAERAFAPGSPLVDPELPPVVYTAPAGLLSGEGSSARDERFEAPPWHVPPFGVVALDRSPREPELQRLIAGLGRRLEGLDLFGSPDFALRSAAFYSGGVIRDAIRILRSAILAGAPAGRVNDHHVQLGLREIRQDLEQGLTAYEIDLLRQASRGEVVLEPSLVASNRLIPYEGGERRYWLPHPLLWDLVDARPGLR